jgi:hypothetical protein
MNEKIRLCVFGWSLALISVVTGYAESRDPNPEILFLGISRSSADEGLAPKPGATAQATAEALYGNAIFFHLRNAFPEFVTNNLGACFTKSLLNHFDKSRAAIDHWKELHKDDQLKLPMNEGAIFISVYEGASQFRVGETNLVKDRARVNIHLSYTEGNDVYEWIDIAIFVQVDGKWLLDEIEFDPANRDGWTLRKRTWLEE